jgi:hypothetical protein
MVGGRLGHLLGWCSLLGTRWYRVVRNGGSRRTGRRHLRSFSTPQLTAINGEEGNTGQ